MLTYDSTTYRIISYNLSKKHYDNPLLPSSRWGELSEKLYGTNEKLGRIYLNNFDSLFASMQYVSSICYPIKNYKMLLLCNKRSKCPPEL